MIGTCDQAVPAAHTLIVINLDDAILPLKGGARGTHLCTCSLLAVVAKDRIKRIDASVADTVSVITQWGVDSAGLYSGGPGGAADATEPVIKATDQV